MYLKKAKTEVGILCKCILPKCKQTVLIIGMIYSIIVGFLY